MQAAISGITAVIDANGVVHEHTLLFQRTLVETTVTTTTGETPYVRYGEWAIWASTVGVAGALLFALRRGRRSRFIDSGAPTTGESVRGGASVGGDSTVAPHLMGTSDTASAETASGEWT